MRQFAALFIALAVVGIGLSYAPVEPLGKSIALSPGHAQSPRTGKRHPGYQSVAEIKSFRRKHGLDLDIAGYPALVTNRARDLADALRAEQPFAVRTARQWGSPLRPSDFQELVFRKRYVAQAFAVVPDWAAENASSAYAGLYINEREGGLIEIGFTANQEALLEALLRDGGLIAPERVRPLATEATYSLSELEALSAQIAEQDWNVREVIHSLSVDVQENRVKIVTEHVMVVMGFVADAFGLSAPIRITFGRPSRVPRSSAVGGFGGLRS